MLSSDKYKVYHIVYLFLYKSISPYLGIHDENKRNPCFPLNICILNDTKNSHEDFPMLYILKSTYME